ncbi:ergothioneine biosynthesis protein EgtB [Sphingomonas cavernae]|uniref:Ergothioneine biosynthesis protein EgtB n=1 Tax=Sphingomonas cavernae TaxID=2320861 RepID=A0A418WRM3_9SPHN|nr:ergothioneine biosynthesis protein EgtB [Sphingomonas cavernae]RJF93867.1 ergothioneine biosynthesis protein EgtB [Sphingomonas cavernae]
MATLLKSTAAPDALSSLFRNVRALSEALVAPLSDADATVQSMDDASPAKWHLAHTTWFFESFVLRDHVPGYQLFDDRWPFLFNSYYEVEGPRYARPRRGMITRPSLAEVLCWRAHVNAALIEALPELGDRARALVELGCHHEQQHQELLLTDILSLFALNPLAPAIWDMPRGAPAPAPAPLRWIEGAHGIVEIGHDGTDVNAGFGFDCEGPRHPVLLPRHALGDRLVTNAEWRGFIDDGGYERPDFWLSDGWTWVQREGIEAPLYWRHQPDGEWAQFALDGLHPVRPAAPVTHISYYEADAFARWAGARLPTEAEWESAAATLDPLGGNQLDTAGPARPRAATNGEGLRQMFGDVWEWTASAYLAYPGFRPAPGAVGEYNGKFMSGQFVLKGASCATPRGHARASYRNFFYPHQRWQFTGLRLAKDL